MKRPAAPASGQRRERTAARGAAVRWVGTWTSAPQLVEAENLPPVPGLAGNTLRQIVHVTIGGNHLRVSFSNAYGEAAVTMRSVHLAPSTGGGGIDAARDARLSFGGRSGVTIAAGATVVSDPLDYALPPLTKLAITISFGATPTSLTGHPGSRTTSYLASGDVAAVARWPGAAATTEHWYYLTGVDVMAGAGTAAVVTLGDSITDGRGSTTDGNDRWPDHLARRLQAGDGAAAIAVLNQGMGGNAVLAGGMGPTALDRFARDVLNQSGVRWLVVLEGVNDIGAATDPKVATELIAAFQRFASLARARNIRAYGIPILPFGGSMYDSPAHQISRQTVNDWIRAPGNLDAVIDLDAALGDPANPSGLLAAYDSGDHLHLSPAGYRKMADAIDLTLFSP